MNFGAGPGCLPTEALALARDELLDFQATGMSIMEHSHRGSTYDAVHREAEALLRELTGLGSDHEVLFLQGGASMQFAQVPMAFLRVGTRAAYAVDGVWAEKALKEATTVAAGVGAEVSLANPRPPAGRAYRPSDVRVPEDAAYLHVTSNETIDGIQHGAGEGVQLADAFAPVGEGAPLVCDMSSDFLWRPVDLSRFALVYAGAQKNVGPSGLCVVIVRRDFLATARTDLPTMLRYDVAAKERSMPNTPPTFAIYMMRNVLSWCKGQGGLGEMERRNREKARLVYGAIDAHPDVFSCPVEPGARSHMNVVFHLANGALETRFVEEAKARGMVGLKGHRSVGGMRASLYNAVPVEWARTLADFMHGFAADGQTRELLGR